MNPAFILTEKSLTVVYEGKTKTITSSSPAWKMCIVALKEKDYESLKKYLETQAAFEKFTGGTSSSGDGVVYFAGEVIHNVVTEKIISFMEHNLPHEPLVKFLERLLANPSRRAINELYNFLTHKNLPITENGTFLAYKSIRPDWTDHHSGSFLNTIGSVLEMKRNLVDDNYQHGCSYGFHAGSLEYAAQFGGENAIRVIVEIDPADVVSIPSDCDCQKLRTCRYKVISRYLGALPAVYAHAEEPYNLTNHQSETSKSSLKDWEDDDWQDEEDDVVVSIKLGDHTKQFTRDSKGRFSKKS